MVKYLIYPFILTFALVVYFLLLSHNVVPVPFTPSSTFFITLPVILLFERYYPYKREWNINLGDLSTDVIVTLILIPVVTISLEKFEIFLNQHLGIWSLADNFSFWPQFIVVLLSSEFLFYWYHRYSHKQKTLLKFHSVHHGANRLYWANSGRFHFVDAAIQFAIYFIPVFLLRASPEVATLLLTLTAITGTLEHANIDYKTKYFSYFFNTAEIHHLHHSPELDKINMNFGKILVLFDLLFGTYIKSEEARQRLSPGLPFEKKVPNKLVEQLKFPFN